MRDEYIWGADGVAPLVGAWIEIVPGKCLPEKKEVAPLVGAWIEIQNLQKTGDLTQSRSSCRSVD